jgi:hypothetical protein
MGIFGGAPKGPSAEQIRKEQEDAARKERDKIALETAGTQASQQKQLTAAAGENNRNLAASVIDEETGRKKFLKGI